MRSGRSTGSQTQQTLLWLGRCYPSRLCSGCRVPNIVLPFSEQRPRPKRPPTADQPSHECPGPETWMFAGWEDLEPQQMLPESLGTSVEVPFEIVVGPEAGGQADEKRHPVSWPEHLAFKTPLPYAGRNILNYQGWQRHRRQHSHNYDKKIEIERYEASCQAYTGLFDDRAVPLRPPERKGEP